MEQKRIRAANWPLSSLILDVSEPHSSYGHIVKVILHFHNIVGELVLHWFSSTFPGFQFNFLQSCSEIHFCRVDAFIIKSCVFLLANLILAAYVVFTCLSMTTFVMILINSSSSCVIGFKKDLITFFNFTMFFSCLVQTDNNRSWRMLRDVLGVCHLVCIFS